MRPMIEHDRLLAQIFADPDSDQARLTFADWLAANNDQPRAEFIRLQCELVRWQNSAGDCTAPFNAARPCQQCEPCSAWIRQAPELRSREVALLEQHGTQWVERLARVFVPNAVQFKTFGYRGGFNPQDRRQHHWQWRRGFVDVLSCQWIDFAVRADAVTALIPLKLVQLSSSPDVCVATRMSFHEPHKAGILVRLVGRKLTLAVDSIQPPQTIIELLAAEWRHIRFDLPP